MNSKDTAIAVSNAVRKCRIKQPAITGVACRKAHSHPRRIILIREISVMTRSCIVRTKGLLMPAENAGFQDDLIGIMEKALNAQLYRVYGSVKLP